MIEKNTSKAEIWKSIRMNILIASHTHQLNNILKELELRKITKEEFLEKQNAEFKRHQNLVEALKQDIEAENKYNNSST